MKTYVNEEGYIQLIKDIMSVSESTNDRTGCGTKKIFGACLSFPNVEKAFALFTARPIPIRFCFEEMMMFLNGVVQTKCLEEKGINFWKEHTSRAFLDNRGLDYLPEGHMGYAYGAVMRHSGGQYDNEFNPVGGFDQLKYVIDELQKDIWSRRAMIELWSPADLDRMALTPCCHNYNFCATLGEDGQPELNLAVKVRSSDTPFGLSANAPQFSFLLVTMAKLLKVRAKCLSLILVDAHIYSGSYANQIPLMEEAVTRKMNPLPQLQINKELNSMEDLLSLTIDDIEMLNWNPNKEPMLARRPPMAI